MSDPIATTNRPGFWLFHGAYLEAVEFTECHSDNPEMSSATGYSLQALDAFQADCEAFYEANADHIPGEMLSQAGHDFWLTRNGHGAGFWDGDWPEPKASILDRASTAFGLCEVYAGDDGLIYVFGREG